MKILPLLSLAALFLAQPLRAADTTDAALARADDARVAATLGADGAQLAALLSDELRYVHSSGAVDGKASFSAAIVSGHLKYLTFDYSERKFSAVAPGVELMTGRVRTRVGRDGNFHDLNLSYLAVWRQEQGAWRFLAWQSCKLPDEPPAGK